MATFADILDALEADVLKNGYSGVSTYVRTTCAVPLKAEEGLCGIVQPKPPLTGEERISTTEGYPQRVLESIDDDIDFKDLDSEGRTLVLDFGLFVLINVYCPNDGNGTDERNKYKADFHTVLEARIKGLVEVEGREVILVGDLNACAAVIDHCEGPLMVAKGLAEGLVGEEGFWGKECRRWMRDFMVTEDGTGGHMVDITRRLWPDRKGMYTCWNTKISARDSNYGTRIDYVMITPGLLPWVKSADIQPHIKGSDHCPVYVDLHDEIVGSTGETIRLQDVIGAKKCSPMEPPRIASKFWDEYSGKQRLLQHFFEKSTAIPPLPASSPETPDDLDGASIVLESRPAESSATPSSSSGAHSSEISQKSPPASHPPQSLPSSTTVKRKLTADTLSRTKKKPKQTKSSEKKTGQATIASFFAKSSTSATTSSSKQICKSRDAGHVSAPCAGVIIDVDNVDVDVSSQTEAETLSLSQRSSDSTDAKQAWSSIMAPVQPPRCTVHGEPAKELTVTKPGPNKGKKFFICSR
ncbi:hypothetical protein C0992_001079 [Termitomyces sp. T32_za158]|nr:hypothetical protein C0992_001079 [Termitomyces sp. T32_za158]